MAPNRWLRLFLLLATIAKLSDAAAFLGDKLPLEITVTTPFELLESDRLTLEGTQAITVGFSRPVQALGSGFETSSTPDQIPFSLSCAVPGRFRWVTTFTARFDPSIPWPTDLKCTLTWNTKLTAYDGAKLVAPKLKSVSLTTAPLEVSLQSVSSATVAKLTDGLWDTNAGAPPDKLPEVPPDGTITLRFSSGISIELIQASLKVYSDAKGKPRAPTPVGLKVGRCPLVQVPIPLADSSAAGDASGSPSPSALPNCVQVNLTTALQPDTYYHLCVPAGARYSPYAGAPAKPICTRIAGLRPFRIPLRKLGDLETAQYKRLDLWLPHGLQPTTGVAAISGALTLCRMRGANCTPVKFAVSLPKKAILRIASDALVPGGKYRLEVKASASIKDGYGQPLQASAAEFVMASISPELTATSSSTIVTFEAAGMTSSVVWPYVAYGRPSQVSNASFWSNAAVPARLSKVLDSSGLTSDRNFGEQLGKPDGTVQTLPINKWYPLQLKLSSVPGPWLVASCCRAVDFGDGKPKSYSVGATLLQEASLMATAVLANRRLLVLVTSPTGPAAGVPLDLFLSPDLKPTSLVGVSRTDANGIAVLTAPSRKPDEWFLLTAVLRPADGAPILLPGLTVTAVDAQDPYSGSVVLDRRLVRTGEKLHVSGVIRKLSSTSAFALPGSTTSIALQLSPNPIASNDTTPTYPLTVDPTFGTFTLDISLPAAAKFGAYSVSIVVGTGSAAPSTPSAAPPKVGRGAVATGGASGGPASWNAVLGGSADFTVADPRPPTVALELSVPNWVPTNGTLAIEVQTVSYLGSVLSQAPIGITWTYGSASGELNVTTDANGTAKTTLDLAAILAASQPTDFPPVSVDLIAELVGPTRERITQQASVPVADSRYAVVVSPSLQTDVPGVPFFVTASVQDNQAGKSVQGGAVTVSIAAPPKGPKPECSLPPACTVASGSYKYSNCSLMLPCIGDFVLKACYQDSCSSTNIGKNATAWAAAPLTAASVDLVATLDAADYTVGQTATIYCQLPRPASAVLLVVASASNTTTQVFKAVPAGLFQAPIKIEESLSAGASVQLVAHLPRSQQQPPKVPTSILFDPNAPTSLLASVSITVVQSNKVEVSINAPKQLEPGATGQVGIQVKGAGGPARVVVLAVDQAVLDLLPYPLPSFADGLDTYSLIPQFITATLGTTMVNRAGLQAVFNAAKTLLAKDPWLAASNILSVLQTGDRQPVDTPMHELLAQFTYQLSAFPSVSMNSLGGGDILTGSGPDDSSGVPKPRRRSRTRSPESSSTADSGTTVRSESEFESTPLFTLITVDTDGAGLVNFTAPLNLGTFALRAFAVTGSSTRAGSAESQVVVRRKVSLTASTPRFVRTGDTFEAGVVVTVATAEAAVVVTVGVKLGAGSRATLVGSASQAVTLTQDEKQKEVRFRFKAAAVAGSIDATFTASDGAGAQDGLQLTVPVETQLQPVLLGTSFAINASASTPWQEGLQLPDAAPGTGSVDLTASVGFLAAVQASRRQVTANTPKTPDGYWAAAVALHSGALRLYKQPVEANSALTKALSWLKTLTSTKLGLAPYPPSLDYYPDRPDISLNTWAAFLVSTYPAAALDPALTSAAPIWAKAAAHQLTLDAKEYRSAAKAAWPELDTLAWVRAVLGTNWQPDTRDAAVKNDLAWGRLTSNISALSPTSRSLVALTLLREKVAPTDKAVADVTKRLQSALRIQGRTAYIADGTGSSAAGLEDQALALLTLTAAGVRTPLILPLAAYVAANKPPARILWAALPTSPSPRLAALVQAALASYDAWVGNTQPDLSITANAGTTRLLTASFKGPAAKPVTRSTPWDRLPPNATAIDFKATGTGQATVAATLQFVPGRPLQTPTYRGIWVQKAYQAVAAGTGDAVGPSLARVKLGSLVAVTVQLTTPDDLPDVELQVPLPGGLEPQDPSIFSGAAAQITCAEGASLPRRYPWWWWPVCPAQETRPSLVTFRYAQLTAGAHSVRFLAVAASVGVFTDPPAKAFVAKQPELMGLTPSGRVEVCDGAACAPAAVPVAAPLKDCNGGCSGNGACNLTSGQCICDEGFSGADCSKRGA